MGIKHKKLKEWVAAGVISQDTANAIQAHEDNKKRGSFGRGLINLSIFAIVIGILSIIASNWHEIPPPVKIGVHVILNFIIGWVAYRADQKGKDIWREGASLALFGLTMTLIILIGQIYQLTGSLAGALTLWMVATLPFMALMGRTFATAVPWLLALLVTICVVAFRYLPLLPEDTQFYFLLALVSYLPLMLVAAGRSNFLERHKHALAYITARAGILWLLIGASAAIALWPLMDNMPPEIAMSRFKIFVILLIGLAAIGFYAGIKKFYRGDEVSRHIALFAAISFVMTLAPSLLAGFGGSLLAALLFIAYWIFVGWSGQMIGHIRVVSLAIMVIAIRIYIVYVELFKSLMDTGVGLIVGGVVMLFMIWAARKLNDRLTKKGAAHAG